MEIAASGTISFVSSGSVCVTFSFVASERTFVQPDSSNTTVKRRAIIFFIGVLLSSFSFRADDTRPYKHNLG
jgi:hypothetical protein